MRRDEAFERVMAQRAADPLRAVTFVVPARVAGLALRRELGLRGAYAGVRFETMPRLAELAGAAALAEKGRRPLARPIGDYAAGEVARLSGGALARVAELPGYARVLRRYFQRLRRGGLRSGADVDAGLREDPAVAELLRAYDRFRDLTADFYDDEDLLDAAAEVVAGGQGGIAAEIGELYLLPPSVRTAGGEAFRKALAGAGRTAFEVEDEAVSVQPQFALLPDPASEAEAVVRRVIEALERGAGLHEVAVFHGADRAYGPLLSSAFARAGVPIARYPGQPLIETPAGRAVLALLSLPAEEYSRVAVMDFFALAQAPATLPVGGEALAVRPATWDRLSRDAGVTRGRARWREGLAALAGELRERAASGEGAGSPFLEANALAAEGLASLVEEMAARLEPLDEAQPAGRFVERLTGVVREYVRKDAPGFDPVMEEVAQLGTVAAIGGSFDLARFRAALEANLRAAATREGRFGEGVFVADYRSAAGLRFPHVFVCGAYEGVFPAAASVEPVVDDGWWQAVRQAHPFVEDGAARLARERAAARRALAAATQSLTVSAPLATGLGTQVRYPSPLCAEVASELSGRQVTAVAIREGKAPRCERAFSPLASSLAGPVLDTFELELRTAVGGTQGRWARLEGGRLDRAAELRRRRRARALTEWDGLVLPGVPLLAPERQLSPTAMEDYAACGFRFFLKSVLRLRAPEEPEELQTMDAAVRGTVVHRVLERFFAGAQEAGRPKTGEAWGPDDEEQLLALLDEELAKQAERGRTGLAIFHEHERAGLRADLVRFLAEDTAARRERGSIPVAFEQRFTGVDIGGRLFQGVADRVDRTPGGRRVWVIDYKTGKADHYRPAEGDPFNGGTQLQLGVYAEALQAGKGVRVAGQYWFISQRGAFEQVTYEHSPENAERLAAVVESIGAGIEAGVFPAVPGDETWPPGFENCRYCDFDRLCSSRREADFTARDEAGALTAWKAVGETARASDG